MGGRPCLVFRPDARQRLCRRQRRGAQPRSALGRGSQGYQSPYRPIDGQRSGRLKLVGQASETIGDIVASVRRATEMMGEISLASGEQTRGIRHVGGIVDMNGATRDNADMARQGSETAAILREAQRLSEIVGRFRLQQQAGSSPTAVMPGSWGACSNLADTRHRRSGHEADPAMRRNGQGQHGHHRRGRARERGFARCSRAPAWPAVP